MSSIRHGQVSNSHRPNAMERSAGLVLSRAPSRSPAIGAAARRTAATLLLASLLVPALSLRVDAQVRQDSADSISGVVVITEGATSALVSLRLRDVTTGELAGATSAVADGTFRFRTVQTGTYIIEAVCRGGRVIAATGPVNMSSRTPVTGIRLALPATLCGDAAPPRAAIGAAKGDTAKILLIAAAAAGLTAFVTVAEGGKASPSR